MSYEIVIKNTKKIESTLYAMGAKGKGLYEKSLSIETKLNSKTLNSIRFIATIRNKLLHEDGFELSSELLDNFLNQCNSVCTTLDKILISKSDNNLNTNISIKSNNKSQVICSYCEHAFYVHSDDVYRLEHYGVELPRICSSCLEKKDNLNNQLQAICSYCNNLFYIPNGYDAIYDSEILTICNDCLEKRDENDIDFTLNNIKFKSKDIFFRNIVLILIIIVIGYYIFLK